MADVDYERHRGQRAGQARVPSHVAIIMDGNGRWAKAKGYPRIKGHSKGKESVRDIVKCCISKKVKALTLFAFGQENWKRPAGEVRHLFRLLYVVLKREVKELHQQGVRIRLFGEHHDLPKSVQDVIKNAQAITKDNTTLNLNVMFSYSGRWDILQAIQKVVNHPNAKSEYERLFKDALCLHEMPEPDLLIRTAGVQRISNFLLWDLAYTELYFTNTHWPDFDEAAFDKALDFYQKQERRFGLISEQVEREYA